MNTLDTFVDGCLIPVPLDAKEEYITHAQQAMEVFIEYGALEVRECWGVDIPNGEITSLPLAVDKQPNETVVLSWIIWPSKESRDNAWQRIQSDNRMHWGKDNMPFDGMRMIYGGFQTIVSNS